MAAGCSAGGCSTQALLVAWGTNVQLACRGAQLGSGIAVYRKHWSRRVWVGVKVWEPCVMAFHLVLSGFSLEWAELKMGFTRCIGTSLSSSNCKGFAKAVLAKAVLAQG
jgi:hypothetical protein